ncbi:MAG: hypothetical protein ACR2J3_04045 [Aridibacter sp.]
MKKVILILIIISAMYSFVSAQSLMAELDKVEEIQLLESSREDVIKLLAENSLKFSDGYFFTNYSVTKVFYSSGSCYKDFEDWNILGGRVTQISVIPKDFIHIKDLEKDTKIDYKKLRKEKMWGRSKGRYVYSDKDLGIAITTRGDFVSQLIFTPSKEKFSMLCDKEEVKKYYSNNNWNRYTWNKLNFDDSNSPANVSDLILSRTEIIADCGSLNATENKDCLSDTKKISVSTTATDFESDVLVYYYKVSGGKIIGKGAKVFWDLSGVEKGTYTITAAADDGCGLCGKFITKTVVVK